VSVRHQFLPEVDSHPVRTNRYAHGSNNNARMVQMRRFELVALGITILIGKSRTLRAGESVAS
jgi:hypothetical protein